MAKQNYEDWRIENIGDDLEKWANNTAMQFILALRKYGIGVSHELLRSVAKELQQSGGDIQKVTFKFLRYGRFVDMGTGREFARGGRGTANFARYRNDNGSLKSKSKRKPKPWYSKTAYREIKYLSEYMLANMSEGVMETVKARIRRINTHSSRTS